MGQTDNTMKVALIQLNSSNDKKHNLQRIEQWIIRICKAHSPDLIALPEMFNLMGGSIKQKSAAAEVADQGESLLLLKRLAKQFQTIIHGGSIYEADGDKFYNTTYIINEQGQVITKYRKINLFSFSSATTRYNESALLSAGQDICIYQVKGKKIGCVICFDIRFGDIFQRFKQKNVDIIILPAAFAYETGQAHWKILCQARAIETQSFLIAPAQTGSHFLNGCEFKCYGHSMIVDPWGRVMGELAEDEGYLCRLLDINFQQEVRRKMPCR